MTPAPVSLGHDSPMYATIIPWVFKVLHVKKKKKKLKCEQLMNFCDIL